MEEEKKRKVRLRMRKVPSVRPAALCDVTEGPRRLTATSSDNVASFLFVCVCVCVSACALPKRQEAKIGCYCARLQTEG